MRTRRVWTWLIFAVAALLVVEALAWVTWRSLTLERQERLARAESRFQEAIRLALWRMDSELTPILAQEAARPYFHYRSFYPATRGYGRMWEPLGPEEPLAASPLLDPPGPLVRLHYEIDASGTLSSPQVPGLDVREWSAVREVGAEVLMLSRSRLDELRRALDRPASPDAVAKLGRAAESISTATAAPAMAYTTGDTARKSIAGVDAAAEDFAAREEAANRAQMLSSTQRQRAGGYQTDDTRSIPAAEARTPKPATPQALPAPSGTPALAESAGALAVPSPAPSEQPPATRTDAPVIAGEDVEQSALTARWLVGDGAPELVLERTVRVGAASVTQGVWMDWPALRGQLIAAARGVLPAARPEPLVGEGGRGGLRLASIPAVLDPGPVFAPEPWRFTATHAVLAATWAAALGSIGAIAFVLHKSMDLSDRRGRFVSAVTHELRTPLTTFTLYTDMLKSGLITDETRKAEYLSTLHAESRRLSGIVENVLSYARLGRSAGGSAAVIEVATLMAQVEPALRRAAEAGGMMLEGPGELNADLGSAQVRAEAASVERILLNLVDNAAKYASESADRRIHLHVRAGSTARRGTVELAVRDHGPGVPAGERRRVFEPFHRAARDEASPKPGLGLGLALARGLARELGGDLRLAAGSHGAEFVLELPRV